MTAPPGAALLLLAYGAGLATGLSHFLDLRVVLFATIGVAAWVRRGPAFIALVAAATGIIVGVIASRPAPGDCGSLLHAGAQTLRVVLEEPGAPGMIRATAAERCTGDIRLRWPANVRAPSGSEVTVSGRWVPRRAALGRPDGMLLVQSARASRIPAARRVRDLVHDVVADRSRALFGDRAALVDALVTGRRGEMSPELKEAFSAAGLVHLLSISGFHIGLIAGWLLLVLRLTPLPRHVAEATAAVLALGYVAFLGWPAPAARAGWLLVLIAWSRWRQRNVGPVPMLATTCLLVVVFDPWAVADLGGWLSASALLGAVVLSRWSDRMIGTGWGWRTLSASIGATLGTAPITAMAFGQVALVGIVLNFLAIPLAAAAVPAVLVALLLVPVAPTLAGAFAAAGGAVLGLIERIAAVGASVPFGQWTSEPGPAALMPWLLAGGVVHLLIRGGATLGEAARRAAWSAVGAAWIILGVAVPRGGGGGRLTLHFLDVGQGDAALIRTPAGRWIAVDAGPAGNGSDAGRRVVVPFLRRHGARRIDLFVLSHAHRDHVGGAAWLSRHLPVVLALDPGMPFDDETYLEWLDALAEGDARWRVGTAGDSWTIDGVAFRVLHPATGWSGRGDDLNEDSLVLEVSYGDFSAILTGDAGFPAEESFLARTRVADVLKTGHHGSRGSTGEALLRRLKPRVAVLSLGRNNYGHPAPETLRRLAAAGVLAVRTDQEGTISVSTDGRTFEVRGRRTRTALDAVP